MILDHPSPHRRSTAARSRAHRLSPAVAALRAMAFLLAAGCASDLARAAASAQEWVAPAEDPQAAVTLTADRGASQRVGQLQRWLLEGNVQVVQALQTIAADRAVVWIDPGDDQRPTRLVVYVEGGVHVQWQRAGPLPMIERAAPQPPPDRLVDEVWLGRLFTWREPIVRVTAPVAAGLSVDELIARGEAARTAGLPASVAAVGFQQSETPQMVSPQTGWVQPTIPQAGPPGGLPLGGPIPGAIPAATRIEILPRQSTVPLNLKTLPGSTPNERVLVASGGVRLVIDSSALAALPAPTGDAAQRVIVLADNVVAWSNALDPSNPAPDQARWEIYLEGNVVFSSGQRTIYASRMYYDATYRRGTLMHAHFYTPVDRTPGLVRLKADVLQQVDANRYQAMGAAFTSSRIGFPRYWLQSDQLEVDALPSGLPGSPLPDPYGADLGGSPALGEVYTARSFGNRVYWGGMPIFYWPRIETRLDEPSFYLRSIRVGNDDIFGFQVRTRWDLNQLLGRRPPGRRSEWLGAVDWLSDRGLGFGTEAEYELDALFGFAGDIRGRYQSWFIHDGGVDNLGRDRRAVPLEEDWRGRIVWNHRHRFRPGLKLDAEVGYLSDRNFLEQYFQQEWDTGKDLTSGLHVERLEANRSLNVWAEVQLNEFFTQTSWLPRADYFMLGQNVWGSLLVYHGHSHVGYGQFDPAEAPTNPVDLAKFDPLAWETASAQGIRAGTRHELDLPLQLGAVRVVPYLLVDGTYWQEDLDGSELSRIYGQTGVRASLPFWRADPTICSSLFNVNGLAHKVTLDAEFGYADASRDWDRLPLYDPLDDDAQEFFRRRFAFDTFGIVAGLDVPLRFDERDFARRYALQSHVTSPTAEIADDLLFLRTGFRQRWQTKRGLPGRENIIDWITFDVDATVFPDADRDNYGSPIGLIDYDFRWYVGDRLSLVSDGFFDTFSQGLRTLSVGTELHRPRMGDLYLGVRSIEGPISSNVLTARCTYRMSDKWGIQASSAYDFGEAGNIGQRLAAVYLGESFLYRMGINWDVSRGNVGFLFGIEPRFLARPQLFRPGGAALPPASAEYLE